MSSLVTRLTKNELIASFGSSGPKYGKTGAVVVEAAGVAIN